VDDPAEVLAGDNFVSSEVLRSTENLEILAETLDVSVQL